MQIIERKVSLSLSIYIAISCTLLAHSHNAIVKNARNIIYLNNTSSSSSSSSSSSQKRERENRRRREVFGDWDWVEDNMWWWLAERTTSPSHFPPKHERVEGWYVRRSQTDRSRSRQTSGRIFLPFFPHCCFHDTLIGLLLTTILLFVEPSPPPPPASMALRPPVLVPLLRRCLTLTKYAAGSVFVASMTSAWYYRPIPAKIVSDCDNNNNNHSQHHQYPTTNKDIIIDRSKEFFCAPYASPPWNREHVPILLEWARRISIGFTTLAIRILMNTYGQYTIEEDVHYHAFLDAVLGGNYNNNHGQKRGAGRASNQGLITVSNHRSLFDDPGIISCLLPLNIAIQPKFNRWGICSQEYCFNDALPGWIKGYIGAGQVLPICRGAGIHQRLLLDFARHLANGEWCHVFPEGGVWQWDELGGRRQLPPNTVAVSSSDFGKNRQASTSSEEKVVGINTTTTTTTATATTSTSTATSLPRPREIVYATAQQKVLPPSPIGKLKWGVGKLIAHAPVTPKVIPFAHKGLEKLLPQDETTGKTKLRENFLRSFLPNMLLLRSTIAGEGAIVEGGGGGGNGNKKEEVTSSGDKLNVTIRFGKEIVFDDLIREHENQHGKLWKYSGTWNAEEDYHYRESGRKSHPHKQQQRSSRNSDEQAQYELWNSSSDAERVLYSKIVRRIEYHLDDITRKVCQEGE